ncbi:hypothetical protein PO909_003671 [Leuciscus waleckii]
MNLFSGSVDALRSVGNSWIMSLSFIMDQQEKVIRFHIMCLLVCSLIAVLSGEHYATQAQVMSSKALRTSNTRRNDIVECCKRAKAFCGHCGCERA